MLEHRDAQSTLQPVLQIGAEGRSAGDDEAQGVPIVRQVLGPYMLQYGSVQRRTRRVPGGTRVPEPFGQCDGRRLVGSAILPPVINGVRTVTFSPWEW